MGRFIKWSALASIVLVVAGGQLSAAQPEHNSPSIPTGAALIVHPKEIAVATKRPPVKPYLAAPLSRNSKALRHATRANRRLLRIVSQKALAGIHPLAGSVSPAGCAAASGYPLPIATLASSLKCDPDLIYEYVYNNIEFEPLYGSNKGPLGTLLDRRGGDADQAQLLVALWNAAGYPQTQTGYYNEGLVLTGAQISNWLGVPNDCIAIRDLLASGGIPQASASPATCTPGQPLTSIQVNHFVAALQLGGTWYYFDPSFKYHTILTGVSGVSAALGYNRTQFLSDAGGTVGSGGYSISNINRPLLRADLTSYANNLVNYINSNNRAWTVGDVIGGKIIQPLSGSPIRIQESGWTPSSTFPVYCPNQTPSGVECRTYIVVGMPGASPFSAIKLYTDAVYGHRITVFSVPSGSLYVPTLLIDGAVPACVGLGTCTNVGPATSGGSVWTVSSQIVEPNQPIFCSGSVTKCQNLTIAAGGSYLISMGVGQVGRSMAEYHRQLLAQARAAGNADTTELVLGENLAAISYNWLAQVSYQQRLTDQFTQTTTLYNFGVGITGQTNVLQLGYQGPYIDLPVNFSWALCRYSTCPATTIGAYSYPTPFLSASFVKAQTGSAFESGVLLQTQAPVASMTAASTMTLVDANMNSAYSGALQTTYFADGTTAAGQSYFTGTIYPAISSHYGASDLTAISNAVSAGYQVLVPSNGTLSVGLWQGAGYTETQLRSNEMEVSQLITGGMAGGFSGNNIVNPSPNTEATLTGAADSISLKDIINSIPAIPDPTSHEPVDNVTGAYIYSHDDLVTGGNGFPYALPFSRTYLSSSGSYLTTTMADTGMGNGWAHSYSMNAQVESDPYVGMGSSDSPAVSAATSIAALYVMQDLMSVTPTAQTSTVSSMAAHWFVDQLTSNTVLVTQPNTTEEYVALPHNDGSTNFSYNPPPGSAVRFTQTAAGTYTYQQKDGVALNFGPTPTGALKSWVFPNGVHVNLTYTGTNLTGVTNNLGRSLTLSYTGSDVTAVRDDTGRSIGYGYDGYHNLTSFTDPLSAVTNFAYDTTGTYDTMGHLTQVYYPTDPAIPFVTNTYDPMGRVAFQANANSDTSTFYIAGSRSELVDALGNREVTYQSDLGRVISDAWVLSSSFGDVFNDTGQINGVVNVSTTLYDGIGRLTYSTAPEGDNTAYAYATSINPWANNVASITLNPKQLSGLSPIIQTFAYDPNWNKIVTATDGLGLVTKNFYDIGTGNPTASIVDNSSSAGHFNATSRFTYNSLGQILTTTDPLGTLTQMTYDSFGDTTKISRDVGSAGHLNQITSMAYDGLGDITSVTDPNGNVTTSTFDADRRLASVTTPMASSAPGPLTTSFTYNPDGMLLTTRQLVHGAVVRKTNATYTLTGKTYQAIDADGHVTTMAYDADDRLASTADPVHNVTSYAYDAMSRQTQIFNAAIQSAPLQQTAYKPDGPVASLTDANSNVTSYAYDGFNRLAVATYPTPSGGSATTETYAYDADNNVLSEVTRRGDALSFAYDTLNRRCTKAIATLSTSCSATSSGNPTVWYTYDLNNHMIAANDNSATPVHVPASSSSYVTTTSYDALDHPVNVSWNPAPVQTMSTAASVTFQYAYDDNNRRVTQTATDSSWWSYPATASHSTYNTNALNQYTCIFVSTCSAMFTYDGNGNLTYDGTFIYAYDAENRLTSIKNGAVTVATYAYDSLGRRKSKTVGSTTTDYVTDADDREILEYSGSNGTLQNWYAYGIGSNDVLNEMNVAANTRETMVPDIQGSIIATLDASSGTLSKTAYQTFGEHPGLSNGTFNYTAQRFDPETTGSSTEPSGLYYYRARMYSPTMGRFLQIDPIGYPSGMNLYAYVGNDPINNADPSGRCVEDLCILEGAAAIEAVETAPVWIPAVVAGAKAAAGFAIGYGGAALSGVQSQGGRIAGGVIGALTLPIGSLATGIAAKTFAYGSSGATASIVTGGALSTTTGAAGSAAGQYFDTGKVTLGQTALGGVVGLGAYTFSGGAAVDYGLGYLGTGATDLQGALLDISTSFNGTAVGSELDLAADKIGSTKSTAQGTPTSESAK